MCRVLSIELLYSTKLKCASFSCLTSFFKLSLNNEIISRNFFLFNRPVY